MTASDASQSDGQLERSVVETLYQEHEQELRRLLLGILRDHQLVGDVLHITFAKVISTTNGEDANRTSLGAVQNQYDRRNDKAVASQDTPHNLRISYVYELPIGRGRLHLRLHIWVIHLPHQCIEIRRCSRTSACTFSA